MKIDGMRPPEGGGEIPKKKAEKTSGKPFESFLKESASAPKEKSGAAPLPPPAAHTPVSAPAGQAVQTQAVKQVESLLADLEFYRNILGKSDVPLPRLEPMAETLMKKKDSLTVMLPHVDDPELKDLITQTAALVINENNRLHLN
ncbi:MAG: hypothetical protein IEMM0002_0998 [bacterium]|nr:MAG: hypothetical protein IEMM0002_0998 [bacterium]